MTYPTEKSPSISKPNKFFDLSFVGFDKMTQFIAPFVLLWMLNAFIDRMIGLWNDHSDYINNIFLSMNVAHAKSGSTIQCIPGLTHGLLGIMFCGAWQMFCLDFAVIQVVFWWQPVLFFKRKVNFFRFNVIKINHVIVDFARNVLILATAYFSCCL